MSKDKKLKVTLVKSLIGRIPQHRKVIESLGLRKLHRSVIQPDNVAIRGMIRKVDYLLNVEEVK